MLLPVFLLIVVKAPGLDLQVPRRDRERGRPVGADAHARAGRAGPCTSASASWPGTAVTAAFAAAGMLEPFGAAGASCSLSLPARSWRRRSGGRARPRASAAANTLLAVMYVGWLLGLRHSAAPDSPRRRRADPVPRRRHVGGGDGGLPRGLDDRPAQLAPVISPRKTVEGAAAQVIASVAIGAVLRRAGCCPPAAASSRSWRRGTARRGGPGRRPRGVGDQAERGHQGHRRAHPRSRRVSSTGSTASCSTSRPSTTSRLVGVRDEARHDPRRHRLHRPAHARARVELPRRVQRWPGWRPAAPTSSSSPISAASTRRRRSRCSTPTPAIAWPGCCRRRGRSCWPAPTGWSRWPATSTPTSSSPRWWAAWACCRRWPPSRRDARWRSPTRRRS